MFLDVAGRVGRAGRIRARIDAAVVAAGEISRAAVIPQADRQRGIAVAYADADGPMVHHLAALVAGTGRFGSDVARVLALAVDARRIRGTVKVLATGRRVRGAGEFAQFVHDEAVLADAHRPVVAHLAALVHLAAVLEIGTRIAALAGLRVAGEAG